MKYVAGVDIGNATTEVALAKIDGQDIEFLTSGIGPTTGIKGTLQNISGVFMSLKNALEKAGITMASAEVTMIPQTYVTLTDEADITNIGRILDLLDDDDDVQEVYHNWEE